MTTNFIEFLAKKMGRVLLLSIDVETDDQKTGAVSQPRNPLISKGWENLKTVTIKWSFSGQFNRPLIY